MRRKLESRIIATKKKFLRGEVDKTRIGGERKKEKAEKDLKQSPNLRRRENPIKMVWTSTECQKKEYKKIFETKLAPKETKYAHIKLR